MFTILNCLPPNISQILMEEKLTGRLRDIGMPASKQVKKHKKFK